MRDGPEQRIKRQISEFLSYKGAFFWLNYSTGIFDPQRKIYRKRHGKFDMNGTSDILGIYKGKFLAVEVKAGRNQPSQQQILFLTKIIESGGIGICAWSVEDVANLIDNPSIDAMLDALLGLQNHDKSAIS